MSVQALTLFGLEAVDQVPVARATDPVGALHELFGFRAFRPGQAEAVDAALAGRDALVVMPTGSGKSLCYQLPALMRTDLTVVVSPLVSLMQDQVEALKRVAPGRVAQVNAQQDSVANRRALAAAQRGDLRLLYVAPERFSSPAFAERLEGARVGLFVVDEAHCVSQWGHDFRPDYFRLAEAARRLGAQAVMASTATATPRVAADIAERLGLRDPVRVATGFDRPNLTFSVTPVESKAAAHRGITAALAEPDALPAIVYAGTRADADRLAGVLERELDTTVLAYHAGLPREVRADRQRRFMRGDVQVIVATNAFGMGVDKADVRTVAHETVPGSLEAYYQEAGRAGRDGRPARCLLFAGTKDKGLHVFFIERSLVGGDVITAVAKRILAGADGGRYDLGWDALLGAAGGDWDALRSVLGHLAHAEVIRPEPSGPDRARGTLGAPWDGAARDRVNVAAREGAKARWDQYKAVWAWVEGRGCRRAGILRHFGDEGAARPAPAAPVGPLGVPYGAAAAALPAGAPGAAAAAALPAGAPGAAAPAAPLPAAAAMPVPTACCDVCDPAARVKAPPARRGGSGLRHAGALPLTAGGVDGAILAVVAAAEPPLCRTRAVEVLRGGRSKALLRHAYDGLPEYGTFGHLKAREVLARVDALLEGGTLRVRGAQLELAA